MLPRAPDPELLVLHGLRLRGFGEPEAVGAIVGVDGRTVADHLEAFSAAELVARRDGRLAGWTLTAAGRTEHERRLADELEAAGVREQVDACYRRFLECNGEMLETCTAWQLRGDGPNDHTDAAYDESVMARLEALHRLVVPILDELAARLERYGCYRPRLEAALTRLSAGDPDWFTRPMIDSYHTVWFQLHEDLLRTLGYERSEEEVPTAAPDECSALSIEFRYSMPAVRREPAKKRG